jgi:uncharacterized protein (TIGR02246 family)
MNSVLADKDAIGELLHLYCFYMDDGQFAELAALFAPDGEWVAPYRTATGPAEIAAWLAQSVPPEPRRMHYTQNTVIAVDGARATARSNYLVMVAGENGPMASVCGSYRDVLVKRDGVWRFQRRELVHAFRGDMALRLP